MFIQFSHCMFLITEHAEAPEREKGCGIFFICVWTNAAVQVKVDGLAICNLLEICNLQPLVRRGTLRAWYHISGWYWHEQILSHSSVLDLDAFERINKAEGLGMSSDACSGEKNLEDAATTCKLFRFLQLLCEGHNLGE